MVLTLLALLCADFALETTTEVDIQERFQLLSQSASGFDLRLYLNLFFYRAESGTTRCVLVFAQSHPNPGILLTLRWG